MKLSDKLEARRGTFAPTAGDVAEARTLEERVAELEAAWDNCDATKAALAATARAEAAERDASLLGSAMDKMRMAHGGELERADERARTAEAEATKWRKAYEKAGQLATKHLTERDKALSDLEVMGRRLDKARRVANAGADMSTMVEQTWFRRILAIIDGESDG